MISQARHRQSEYVLAERRFGGTHEEVLRQLDELIESLLRFRMWLLSKPENPRE